MNALLLLLTLTSTIVLRSGDRIAADGPVREEKGVVIFRANGLFYSLPASEVERIEKQEPQPQPEIRQETPAKAEKKVPRRLAVSEEERRRLLAELEKNHTGVAQGPLPVLKEIPPPPSREEEREQREEENRWRREARAHEEAVRQANEELALLQARVEELRSQIFSLVGLGYKPRQFTYQTTQLERTLAQIPYAELRVTRAVRAYEQFREDARRQGIMPGWLR
jgi:type IV secretory pathway VirB10-like protein